MLRRDLFALVALAVFSAAYPSQAQVATGTYPLGTYDTLGADTINVGNLNVMLDIPVLHKAGRAGTTFTYDLFYNGAIYTPGKITGQPWTPDQNWGWIAETQPLVGFISENSGTTECLIGSRMYPLIRTLQAAFITIILASPIVSPVLKNTMVALGATPTRSRALIQQMGSIITD
jgi:hypothetical protein